MSRARGHRRFSIPPITTLAPFAIVAAAVLVYANSLRVPFIFDDQTHIVANPLIRRWPPWEAMAHSSRPLVALTLSANYALGKLDVFGYHVFNVLVHALAGILLFGLVRLTIMRSASPLVDRASGIALAAALLWVVHPLHTNAVTYTIQRAESMMALFYLLTLYCLARSADSANAARWHAGAVASYVLGIGSKPIVATAPFVALLYDTCFLGGSIIAALRARWKLYAALLAMSVLVPAFAALAPMDWKGTAGFSTERVTPLAHALTQPGVILHYLRLALWPHPLCLDYGWPLVRDPRQALPAAMAIVTLIVITLVAFRRWPRIAFLGASFFLVLAPTSSFIPLADAAFEHRMYLPLAALVTLAVLGGDAALRALTARGWSRLSTSTGWGVAAAIAILLGGLTVRRNIDYHDPFTLWTRTIAVRPDNPRTHHNLGVVLRDLGRIGPAEQEFREALRLRPDYAGAHVNLGHLLGLRGFEEQALREYRIAIALDSLNTLAYYNLGQAFLQRGNPAEAVVQLSTAARLGPERAAVQNTLGVALFRLGRNREAMERFGEALRLEPDEPEARCNLGFALASEGRIDEAHAEFQRVLEHHPSNGKARKGLALLGVPTP